MPEHLQTPHDCIIPGKCEAERCLGYRPCHREADGTVVLHDVCPIMQIGLICNNIDDEHIDKYRHPVKGVCPYGIYCRIGNDPKSRWHRKQFAHPTEKACCKYMEKCTDMNYHHRCEFSHPVPAIWSPPLPALRPAKRVPEIVIPAPANTPETTPPPTPTYAEVVMRLAALRVQS